MLALFILGGLAVSTTEGAAKPNVLILFADDMGVGDLGVLGHPTISSPNLDALANSGVRFTAWYSGFHICSPSRAAMLTGRLCVRSGTCGTGLGGVFSNKPIGGLPQSETTFAAQLKAVGYTTAAMGKWHLGTKDEFMPMAHGFDSYYGIPYSVDMGQSAWNKGGEFPPLPIIEGLATNSSSYNVIEQPANLDTLSKKYAAHASDFIAASSAAAKPWLLYMAFQHVHTPDFASPEFCGRSRRGLFGDVVEELDWVVGEILSSVAAAGQTENTIVFFTSDNGPWTSHQLAGGWTGPFRDGKGSVWEGGVREPGFVSWPGTIKPRIENEPAATYDIFPTVLAVAGVALPSDRDYDGKNLMPLLTQQTATSPHKCVFYWKGCSDKTTCGVPTDSPLVNKVHPGLWAVRCGGYKTHFMITTESCNVKYMPPGQYQEEPLIYRIDVDPSERFPINKAANPETAKEYAAQLKIASEAVQAHVASLKPVVNQIELGSDARPQQDGGAAICCDPSNSTRPACECNPENMNAFVCSDTTASLLQIRRAAVLTKTRHQEEAREKTAKTPAKEKKVTSPPNVIMFFIDDSGYADSGVYGAPSTETPNINKMAAEGARFTQWYSAHAICTPSRAALMTGRLPIRYGLASTMSGGQSVFTCRSNLGIPQNETTLGEHLKAAGYRTKMIGKWHLGSVQAYLPKQHGFDEYFGIPFSVDMGFAYGNRTEESWSEGDYYGCSPLPLMWNNTVYEQPANLATVNARYTEHAVSYVTSAQELEAPFFLYLAFGHVHTPQYASAEHAGKSKRGIFGDSVAEVDQAVGKVLDAVAGTNTLAILSSDNGAPDAHQHLQAGQLIDAITGSNFGFLGSKTQTWEGGLRVPGVVWWPEVILPQVRHEVASTLDVFATVADAAKAALPHDRAYDSVSLLPLLLAGGGTPLTTPATATAVPPPRNLSFFYAGAHLQAVRMGAYKAHLITQQPNEPHAGPERGFLNQSASGHAPYGVQNPWQLFNVEHDPAELHVISASSGIAKQVLSAIAAAITEHFASVGTPPPGVLDHTCTTTDCRICCDRAKQCVCNPPPAGMHLAGMINHGIVEGLLPAAGGAFQSVRLTNEG